MDAHYRSEDYEPHPFCQEHSGNCALISAVKDGVNEKLRLITWILSLGFPALLATSTYIAGTLANHDKAITRITDRQELVLKRIDIIEHKQAVLDNEWGIKR